MQGLLAATVEIIPFLEFGETLALVLHDEAGPLPEIVPDPQFPAGDAPVAVFDPVLDDFRELLFEKAALAKEGRAFGEDCGRGSARIRREIPCTACPGRRKARCDRRR
jgi:hypothetical protein